MYTRGRKKAEAEEAPPARDHLDVETIERLQQRIQELELQQLRPTRRQKRRKLSPMSGMMGQWTSILLAKKNLGKVHPDDFIDWLSMVERVFDVRDISDKLKVKLVAIKLRQHASLWWAQVINEFDKLRMRCDVVEEEEQVVAQFFGVLKPEIADI
nr:hypothetical protein [Tanacetum cinerariifolium]